MTCQRSWSQAATCCGSHRSIPKPDIFTGRTSKHQLHHSSAPPSSLSGIVKSGCQKSTTRTKRSCQVMPSHTNIIQYDPIASNWCIVCIVAWCWIGQICGFWPKVPFLVWIIPCGMHEGCVLSASSQSPVIPRIYQSHQSFWQTNEFSLLHLS